LKPETCLIILEDVTSKHFLASSKNWLTLLAIEYRGVYIYLPAT